MMKKDKMRRSIAIDPDLLEKAEEVANKDNRSFSNLVTVLLEKFLKIK